MSMTLWPTVWSGNATHADGGGAARWRVRLRARLYSGLMQRWKGPPRHATSPCGSAWPRG